MTTTFCKDCGLDIYQESEKALDGTYAVVWVAPGNGWICDQTDEEHVPVPPFTGVPGYEFDHAGNPMCGHDFMAGTICSDERGHDGAHSARCQVCDGDWYDETCTCERPSDEDEEPEYVNVHEAVTLGIFAINTWLAPDASSAEDVAYLEAHAEEALVGLARIREWIVAQGEDLPEWLTEPLTEEEQS